MKPRCKGRVFHGHSWIDVRCQLRSHKDGYCLAHHPETVAKRESAAAREAYMKTSSFEGDVGGLLSSLKGGPTS